MVTRNSVTFVQHGEKRKPVVVQIILRLHGSAHDVLRSFDIAPSMVGARYVDGRLRAEALEEFVLAVRRCEFPINTTRWTPASAARVIKYSMRGLRAYVPGLRRSCLHQGVPKKEQMTSVRGLLYAEELLSSGVSVGRVVRVLGGRSAGYDCDDPFGKFKYYAGAFVDIVKNMAIKFFGRKGEEKKHHAWRVSSGSSAFDRIDPRLADVHDENALTIVACKELGLLSDVPKAVVAITTAGALDVLVARAVCELVPNSFVEELRVAVRARRQSICARLGRQHRRVHRRRHKTAQSARALLSAVGHAGLSSSVRFARRPRSGGGRDRSGHSGQHVVRRVARQL